MPSTESSSTIKKSLLSAKTRFIFDDFEFLVDKNELHYQGTPCQLDPKMLQLLKLLIYARPNHLSKDQLMAELWPDTQVSDWSLSRLVSDTRKLIEDNGKEQSIIRTVRGKGFAFVAKIDEIIDAYPSNESNDDLAGNQADVLAKQKNQNELPSQKAQPAIWNWLKLEVRILFSVVFISLTYLAYSLYFVEAPQKNSTNHHSIQHIYSVMAEINKNLKLTKTTYLAQKRRRNELKVSLLKKIPEPIPMQSEQRMRLHYPNLTEDEKFIYDQIRAMSEGPTYQGNLRIYQLLEAHNEVYDEIETFHALFSHLSIWLSKFDRLFRNRPDMAFVFVGEEDGVPFPSTIDAEVEKWLAEHAPKDG